MPPPRRGLQATEATVTAAGGMVLVPQWGLGSSRGRRVLLGAGCALLQSVRGVMAGEVEGECGRCPPHPGMGSAMGPDHGDA